MVNNTSNFRKAFEEKIKKTNKVNLLILENFKVINKIINLMYRKIKSKNKFYLCGNGGSASDAQHVATEFMVRFDKKYNRYGIPAICMNTDPTLITACSNDFHFNDIFKRQFETLANKNDLLICFSTSGNSKNIIEVLKSAKKKKITSICFLGNPGGRAKNFSDISLIIPEKNTALIQEAHMLVAHFIIEQIEIKILANK